MKEVPLIQPPDEWMELIAELRAAFTYPRSVHAVDASGERVEVSVHGKVIYRSLNMLMGYLLKLQLQNVALNEELEKLKEKKEESEWPPKTLKG